MKKIFYTYYKLLKQNDIRNIFILLMMIMGTFVCSFSSAFFWRFIKISTVETNNNMYIYEFVNYKGQNNIDLKFIDKKIDYNEINIYYILQNEEIDEICKTSLLQDNLIMLKESVIREKGYKINEEINLFNQTFKLVGESGDNNYISIESELFNNTVFTKLEIKSEDIISNRNLSLISNEYKLSYQNNSIDTGQLIIGSIYLIISLLLCLYNILCLFNYYIRNKEYKYSVVKLSGASDIFINKLIIIECFIPIIIGSISGIIINMLLNSFQNKIFEIKTNFNFNDLCFILFIIIICTTIDLLLFKLKNRKYKLMDKRRWI